MFSYLICRSSAHAEAAAQQQEPADPEVVISMDDYESQNFPQTALWVSESMALRVAQP